MSSVVSFNFATQSVRIVMRNDDPWFVASDVCEALTISNNRMALERLDDDEKGVSSIDTPGGNQELSIINESGLYSLILTSRKPEAKKFKKWVTSEVLPAIRKTGSYSLVKTAVAEPTLVSQSRQYRELIYAIRVFDLTKDAWGKQAAANTVKVLCNHVGVTVPDFALIGKPIEQYQLEV